MPAAIPFENARTISSKLSNATAAQLNSFFDNALHVGPFFLSEQTVTPHAEEKHLFGIDIHYSDINQVPYEDFGVNSVRIAWNLNAVGRIDADYSGFGWLMEHRYTINDNLDGVLVDEIHIVGTSRDAPPQDWRAFSLIKPQIAADSSTGSDNAYFAVESFAFYRSNFTDNGLRLLMQWTATGGAITASTGVGLTFDTPADGTPVIQQKNAANSALIKHPYLDANDTLKIEQPIIAAGGTNAVTNAFLDLTPSAASTGQKGIVLNGPTVTGTYFPTDITASATVALTGRLINTNTAANSVVRHYISSLSASGFEIFAAVNDALGTGCEFGWANTAANFQFCQNGNFSAGSALTIDPYTNITTIAGTANLPLTNFSAQLNLKSYTVGTVPSAATNGGLIYVTDEAGGEVPAFSDETNWRRVTDRAIVS